MFKNQYFVIILQLFYKTELINIALAKATEHNTLLCFRIDL
jgi:hypothetical protein